MTIQIQELAKGTVFFFTRKRLKFAPFYGFSSDWVKMMFFLPTLFFFHPLKSSEWVTVNSSWEKKTTFGRKKNNEKTENRQKIPFCRFLPFADWVFSVEWVACKLFLGKKKPEKKQTRKKKQKMPKTSEWVPLNRFSAEKKTIP